MNKAAIPTRMILKNLILTCVFALIGYLVYHHQKEFAFLAAQLDWGPLILLVLLQIPLIGLGGYPFKVLVIPFGFRLPWRDWVGLSYIANIMNQVLPYRPGMAFRYFYLKRKYGMGLKQFSLAMIIYMLFQMGFAALMIVTPWLNNARLNQVSNPLTHGLWIAAGLIGIALILILMMIWIRRHKSHWLKDQSLFSQLKTFAQQPTLLVKISLSFLVIQAFIVVSFKLVFYALDHPIEWSDAIFITGLFTWTLLVPVTPGNVGLIETLIGGLTQTLYGQFTLGFSAVLLWRIAQLAVGLIMGSSFSWLLLGHLLPQKVKDVDIK